MNKVYISAAVAALILILTGVMASAHNLPPLVVIGLGALLAALKDIQSRMATPPGLQIPDHLRYSADTDETADGSDNV